MPTTNVPPSIAQFINDNAATLCQSSTTISTPYPGTPHFTPPGGLNHAPLFAIEPFEIAINNGIAVG